MKVNIKQLYGTNGDALAFARAAMLVDKKMISRSPIILSKIEDNFIQRLLIGYLRFFKAS